MTTQNPATPAVSVTPASGSFTTAQSLGVTIAVSGSGGTPTGSVVLSSGSYTSPAATLSSGSAMHYDSGRIARRRFRHAHCQVYARLRQLRDLQQRFRNCFGYCHATCDHAHSDRYTYLRQH